MPESVCGPDLRARLMPDTFADCDRRPGHRRHPRPWTSAAIQELALSGGMAGQTANNPVVTAVVVAVAVTADGIGLVGSGSMCKGGALHARHPCGPPGRVSWAGCR
jgi:hypothetical protein